MNAEENETWVYVAEAAKYSGVSQSAINRASREGVLPTQSEGGRRRVPLELVVERLTHKDIDNLIGRIENAASDETAEGRTWAAVMQESLVPFLEQLKAAERRAALAEARLDMLQRSRLSS